MTDIAIRVESLGKQYRIGKRERYKTLRDNLMGAVNASLRRLRHPTSRITEPVEGHTRSTGGWAACGRRRLACLESGRPSSRKAAQ